MGFGWGYWTHNPGHVINLRRNPPPDHVDPLRRIHSSYGHLPSLPGGEPATATEPTVLAEWTRPLDPAWSASPLGGRDGVTAGRIVTTPTGRYLDGIDGRRVPVAPVLPVSVRPVAAIRFPGDPTPRLVTAFDHFARYAAIWTTDGRFPAAFQDQATGLPPVGWWDALQPRDPDGSAALRTVTDDTAAAMLTLATANTHGATSDTIAAILPTVGDRSLRAAIAAHVNTAIAVNAELTTIRTLIAQATTPT
jgi:hypothetical protein